MMRVIITITYIYIYIYITLHAHEYIYIYICMATANKNIYTYIYIYVYIHAYDDADDYIYDIDCLLIAGLLPIHGLLSPTFGFRQATMPMLTPPLVSASLGRACLKNWAQQKLLYIYIFTYAVYCLLLIAYCLFPCLQVPPVVRLDDNLVLVC